MNLCRADARWKARRACEQWAGAVAYELADIDGRPVKLEFRPYITYSEEWEPTPWLVCCDPGRILEAA